MLKQGYAFAELKDARNARFFLQQVQKKYPNSPEAQQAHNKWSEIVGNYSSPLETQQPEAQHLCTSLGEAAASIIHMRDARMPLDTALSISHNAVLKSFSTQPNIANLDNFFRAMVEASYANPGTSASQAKAEITATCVKEHLPEEVLKYINNDAFLSEIRQQSSIKAGTPSYA